MFTHLHLHSEYSLLDGLARIPNVLDRVVADGQPACALTDHGVLYGAIDFYEAARERGVNPIVGTEAYVAPGARQARDAQAKSPYHLTLLAKNRIGYGNLLKLVTAANFEGYYYKPRMDRELLERHREGLIVLSGCPSGELHRALQEGRDADAREISGWYREVFGDDYFIEVQSHENLQEFTAVTPRLIELAHRDRIPLVATNDSHYVDRQDARLHDVLLCIGTNATVSEENRMRLSDDSYYVKTEAEMRSLFPDLGEAIDNTARVAERCELKLDFDRLHLPAPEIPGGLTPDQYLEQLAREGAQRRYPHGGEAVAARLDYELDVVRQTGFSSYFLVVRDFSQYAKKRGILMGVRGSAAASIILYCLGITDIDPLEYRLVFERFLNPERREMPDIDMDFADDRRDEMLRYAADKYGRDRVAQIISFGTLGAKGGVRDVGRALGMSYADTDRVARLVPFAVNQTLERALGESAQLKQAYDLDPAVRSLVDTAQGLEGIARHASTHAAGVVISRDPLVEHVPLQRPARGDDPDALPTTQYAMEQVAKIGLLKMDFLGLSNLTILGRAVEFIRPSRGVEIDLLHLPDGDRKTYDMLSAGETFGVFQLESAGMRRAITDLRPESIGELAALVALYRPGPMQHLSTFCRAKHGEEAVRYPHPDLAEILDETYGVIVYQDQVLLIAQKFAGFSLGEADVMRKAMGKKIAEKMGAERQHFISGSEAKGYRKEDAQAIFDLIEPFAGYAFNKAHAVCYAMIAYQTAYLKANYPVEYMTAVLSLAADDRVAAAVAECARLGVSVLAPDLNRSGSTFQIERPDDGREGIRFGLATIKNVGEGAALEVIAARDGGGPFETIEDFCRRVGMRQANKRAVESMIKAGAFDALGSRGTLATGLDRIASLAQREQRLRDSGQSTMFDLFGDAQSVPLPGLDLVEVETPHAELLAWEKELLGVYVSEHPMSRAAGALSAYVTAMAVELGPESAGQDAVLAGMVTATRLLTTRQGRPSIAATIEDLSGSIEVTVWSDVYESTVDLWQEGHVLLLYVRMRDRDGRLNCTVQRVAHYRPEVEQGAFFGYDPQEWALGATPERRARSAPASFANGHASEEREDAPLSPISAPVAPPPAPVLSPPAPEAAVGGAGNGRGGNGGNDRAPAPAQPRPLRITLRETDDEVADRARLQATVAALAETPGADAVHLRIETREETVELELPPARVDELLEARIAAIIGAAGEVQAPALPAPMSAS